MQSEEFIDEVARIAGITDQDTARRTVMATVETMCMHLSRQQTFDLASQLPKEIAKAAEAGAQQAAADPTEVSLNDLFEQVATRAELPADDIEAGVRATATVFKRSLSRGESIDVVMDAPPELNGLLTG